MIVPQLHSDHTEAAPPVPSLQDLASLRLEMRASFHELSQRLLLLEIEQTLLANKFDALLALIADAINV